MYSLSQTHNGKETFFISMHSLKLYSDKLYQLREFLEAYNDNLRHALTPGRYLCVDESMNQWLGRHLPNLKKVPRKPHAIGQEYKTIADCFRACLAANIDAF